MLNEDFLHLTLSIPHSVYLIFVYFCNFATFYLQATLFSKRALLHWVNGSNITKLQRHSTQIYLCSANFVWLSLSHLLGHSCLFKTFTIKQSHSFSLFHYYFLYFGYSSFTIASAHLMSQSNGLCHSILLWCICAPSSPAPMIGPHCPKDSRIIISSVQVHFF